VFRNEQITYRELDRRANGWAHCLRARGVRPGTLVGISVERSPELAIAVLAVLKAGGAYVPLDPQYPKQRLASMLEDAGCPVVVTTSTQAGGLAIEGREVLYIDQSRRNQVNPTDDPPEVDVRPDDCAYVIFTSGSTGKPNGVLTEHRSLVNNSQFFAKYALLNGDDRVLQLNSLNFDTAAEEIFPCWLAGAALVFWPEPKAPSIAEFVEFVEQQRITLVDLPTAYWHEWASEIAPGNLSFPSSLRTVIIGGEKAIAAKLAAWNQSMRGRVRLFNTYGPTEATITTTAYDAPADLLVGEPIPVGRPISNATLYILDRNLQPVPIGVPGELYIGGAGIARGYLNRPELTNARFIRNPFREAPDPRLYKTGDRARYLADGTVEFLGRTDNQVKWRGFRIELGEIEEAMARHPRVRAAACSLREETRDQPELVAYVVPEPASLAPDELRRFLKDRVPDYMLPSQYIFLENLPLTPNGKVDRNALPRPDRVRLSAEPGFVPPRTDLESQIVSIWKDVLGVEGIGVHDNFFDLGGHSLKVMQALSRLHKAVNIDVPLRRVFEGPTVAEMAVAVLEIMAEGFEGSELSQILDEIEAPRRLQQ
jgi:amino acid adenylation domain-containing protein